MKHLKALPVFARDHMIRHYGLRKRALQHLGLLVRSVEHYAPTVARHEFPLCSDFTRRSTDLQVIWGPRF